MTSWSNSVVLVTGGTGSFGRAFTKVVLERCPPRKLIVFSRDELKQHEMSVIHPVGKGSPMRYFIGDVRDRDRLHRALSGIEPVDVIIHAAALKQVPACEYNPIEAVMTNIMGARNLIDAAIDAGVKKVLALSTDKAVSPVNLYGATKLCAEKLFVQGNSYSHTSGTRFSCARYGNVVGSRGSVIPTFLEQRKTGQLTITDRRMTRFWMTLDQAVEFVLECLGVMKGGEIFVPKLPSVRITDLAGAMAPECDVRVVGIRPGEKLNEVLLSEDESRHSLELDRMYIIEPLHPWWAVEPPDGAKPLADGFRYASDTNDKWHSVEDLQALAEGGFA